MARRFIAVFLASVLAYGNFGIQVALGVEATGGSVDVVEKIEESAPSEAESQPDEDAVAAEPEPEATSQSTDNNDTQAPVATTSDDSTDPDVTPAAEDQLPYSISVTFDGQELTDGENDFMGPNYWTSSQDAKMMSVTLTRNSSYNVKSGKKYVLSLSVPDSLYFGGIPAADAITGVSAVEMKKNASPIFNTRYGRTESYSMSDYSGEMRFELNTSVDQVTVEGIGVRFDPVLLGYKTSGTTLQNSIVVKVVEVDSNKALGEYESSDEHELMARKVDTLTIRNTVTSYGYLSFYSSNNGFETSVVGQGNSASSNGTLSFCVSTSSFTDQVFGSLTLVFHCPYVVVDGQNRYLEFDLSDPALSVNKPAKNGTAGWNLNSVAVYNETDHTITYHFKNVKLERYAILAYTPVFSLPEDLKDSVPSGNGYVVRSSGWETIGQTTYNGVATTSMNLAVGIGSNYFKRDGTNIVLRSSAGYENLSKRNIYRGVAPGSGATGSIGLFDLHNSGVSDSPEVKVDFDFNVDGGTGAKYYVTQVNLPLYGMGNKVDVSYEMSNGDAGTKTFNASSSFSVTRGNLGYQGDVYIKRLSYVTKLRNNTMYHQEVTHGGRNRTNEPCVFLGQMTGEVGQTAKATMTISSVDGTTAITDDDKTQVSATETSTISDDNSVGFGLGRPTIGTSSSSMTGSTLITAGDTARLAVNLTTTGEEYPTPGTNGVNGYHVVENPTLYVCLPDGVSIAGKDQVSGTVGGKSVSPSGVAAVEGSGCVVNGITAKWWAVEYDGANVGINGSIFNANLQFSTDYTMQSLAWDFSNKIIVRSKGQKATWSAASQYSSNPINTLSDLKARGDEGLNALAKGLANDSDAMSKMGMFVYSVSSGTMLNIARAEAKLDVSTSLSLDQGAGGQQSLRVTSAASDINYDIKVASTDGGYADNFNYYIPVPKVSSGTDTNMFVSKMDFSLMMDHEVEISSTDSAGKAISVGDTFKVQYTTQPGLTSESVRSSLVDWTDSADLSEVTAVRISTAENAVIDDGSSYDFHLTFKYSGDDFGAQAGRSVQWRSFGHYTYKRGEGVETTNSYPSQDNSVKLGYKADLTGNPLVMELDTVSANNYVDVSRKLSEQFVNVQTMEIKKVEVSDGTELVSTDPKDLTGSSANSNFWMQFAGNGANFSTLSSSFNGGSFTVASNTPVTLSARTYFSKALTDVNTERYVDIFFGNDDVDIAVRVRLKRSVVAADVNGSGTAAGENFQTVAVSEDAKTIACNASFTALYDVANYVPGNFTAQKLVWKSGDTVAVLPVGTNITMMVLGSDNKVKSWWLYTAKGNESAVDLKNFKRMSGSDDFTYDVGSTAWTELKYQFVVSLPPAGASKGSYSLGFAADARDGVPAFNTVNLQVILDDPANFLLGVNGQTVSYTYNKRGYEDTRNNGKLLALVLTPETDSKLPVDAKITAAGASYARNASGNYIIPLGTAESSQKSIALGLASDMATADNAGFACNFDVSLREFAGLGTSPMAGLEVGTSSIKLTLSAGDKPALKVTGSRVGRLADWTVGQNFKLAASGIPDDATVTVTAYQGLSGTIQATDILSSVGGFFDVNGAVGTWKSGRPTGESELRLSSATKVGTYRLVFEVKRGDDVLLSVPYYIVVRE